MPLHLFNILNTHWHHDEVNPMPPQHLSNDDLIGDNTLMALELHSATTASLF